MRPIQEAFTSFYEKYKESRTPSPRQQKAAAAILGCRTAAMGSHAYVCDECGHIEVSHNSCRDRHCPNCQASSGIVWVEARRDDILDAPYFHAVLTLPPELHPLVYENQRPLYDLMYKASAAALMKLAQDPKYLGAQPGFFSILHTWGDNLHYHPHIHMVIVAGGLTKDNRWRVGKNNFFIPVKVLSKVFRGIFMSRLKQLYKKNPSLYLHGLCGAAKDKYFYGIVNACFRKDWYTFLKPPFSGPDAVIKYLGRYTHRVAISNERIVSVCENQVVFKSKHKDGKLLTLSGVEFIRRFLMHILPKGFVKIRHYGILSNRNRRTKLVLCKSLGGRSATHPSSTGAHNSKVDILIRLIGRDFTVCPCCGLGRMRSTSQVLERAP
jgi:hypothetical protein